MPDADLDLAAADLVRSAFGHAGQKCSAASLAICVGDAYTSARLPRSAGRCGAQPDPRGSATDPSTTLAPLIGPRRRRADRALTTLDDGETWLLEPRLVDPAISCGRPESSTGYEPVSWFHQTECFGPVLGLMRAANLDEALAMQNGTPFGLTGGIHTLNPGDGRQLAGAGPGRQRVHQPSHHRGGRAAPTLRRLERVRRGARREGGWT